MLAFLLSTQTARADDFQAWVERFWPTAKAAGITRQTYDLAFKGMTPDPKVVEAANFQPEYVKPIGEYIDRVVSDKRVETGKTKLVENKELLDAIEKRYGVDRHIIVAIWGVESNFGTQPGDMNVIRSLATLIYTGTKAKFAKPQLIAALKILQRGDINYEAMNGSWAGAMGHTQFIPTTYQAYAVDYDGDGKRNIWGDVARRARVHRELSESLQLADGRELGLRGVAAEGIQSGQGQREHVEDIGRLEQARHRAGQRRRLSAPGRQGDLVRACGARMDPPFWCSIISARSSATMWRNLMPWRSATFPTGLRGDGPFIHPWPTDETHLSFDQRMELQRLLVAKGLLTGDPDGVIGPATLEALKTYQRSNKLPVDGFPSQTLLQMLRKQG